MTHKILHSSLIKEELLLMGSDIAGSERYNKGNNVTSQLNIQMKKKSIPDFRNFQMAEKF